MTLEENLNESAGPLMTITQLAKILNRSPEGLRISLRNENPWVQRVKSARLRLGRRVYFRTSEIAAILSEKDVR
jgi:hypothetical protein